MESRMRGMRVGERMRWRDWGNRRPANGETVEVARQLELLRWLITVLSRRWVGVAHGASRLAGE